MKLNYLDYQNYKKLFQVGLVAELQNDAGERAIGGTLQQRISNCFQVLDGLLRQNESPVVSSIVVAEKRQSASGLDNIVEAVAHILGSNFLKTVCSKTFSIIKF